MKGNPKNDVGLLILRIGLGLIVLVYGCQKMFGILGGQGYAPTIQFMTTKLGIHPVFANLSIAAEFFGALGVLIGILTPIAAFGLACNFAVATFMNFKMLNFSFANVFDASHPDNLPKLLFPATLFFLSLGLMVVGAGKFSLDARLFRRGK